jgi:hypothetical protein
MHNFLCAPSLAKTFDMPYPFPEPMDVASIIRIRMALDSLDFYKIV